jgi:hypothetical protein
MTAIGWTWFAFIAVSAVFAGSLWATIIVELLKSHRRSAVGASTTRPSVWQPRRISDARQVNRSSRWTLAAERSHHTPLAAGVRTGHDADERVRCGSAATGGPDRRCPDGPSSIPSQWSCYPTACHSTPNRSSMARQPQVRREPPDRPRRTVQRRR